MAVAKSAAGLLGLDRGRCPQNLRGKPRGHSAAVVTDILEDKYKRDLHY